MPFRLPTSRTSTRARSFWRASSTLLAGSDRQMMSNGRSNNWFPPDPGLAAVRKRQRQRHCLKARMSYGAPGWLTKPSGSSRSRLRSPRSPRGRWHGSATSDSMRAIRMARSRSDDLAIAAAGQAAANIPDEERTDVMEYRRLEQVARSNRGVATLMALRKTDDTPPDCIVDSADCLQVRPMTSPRRSPPTLTTGCTTRTRAGWRVCSAT